MESVCNFLDMQLPKRLHRSYMQNEKHKINHGNRKRITEKMLFELSSCKCKTSVWVCRVYRLNRFALMAPTVLLFKWHAFWVQRLLHIILKCWCSKKHKKIENSQIKYLSNVFSDNKSKHQQENENITEKKPLQHYYYFCY